MTRNLKDESRCTATSKTTGKRCGNPRLKGAKTCRFHGSATQRSKAKAARVVAEEQASKAVATLGLAVDVSPVEALLEEIRWTAGHVQWLRARVEELEAEELVWGQVEDTVKTGAESGTKSVEKAAASVWYELYARERAHLVTVCAAALRANVDERRVRLAEAQGEQLASVIRAILNDLRLTAAQQKLVGTVVPRHLRAIGGAE